VQIAIKAAREQHSELTAAQKKIAALQKANRSLQEELVREMDKDAQKKVATLRRANRALRAQLFRVVSSQLAPIIFNLSSLLYAGPHHFSQMS